MYQGNRKASVKYYLPVDLVTLLQIKISCDTPKKKKHKQKKTFKPTLKHTNVRLKLL